MSTGRLPSQGRYGLGGNTLSLFVRTYQLPRIAFHLILDDVGTHGHANVKAWLERHPRFMLHFTPTSSSWLNLVERWFGEITRKRIRRGIFRNVPELIAAIEDDIRIHNEDPRPFVWTRKADDILEKVARCKTITETLR